MEVEGTTANGAAIPDPQLNDDPLKKPTTNTETTPSSPGGFDCNICLDIAADPVVTLCGHLYCWPCIYKWLQVDATTTTTSSTVTTQNCPVCKAPVASDSLVPLYGRGCAAKKDHQPVDIPSRPRLNIDNNNNNVVHRHRHHHHYHVHHHYEGNGNGGNEFVSAPSSPLGGTGGRAIGGMAIAVLPWMFGSQREITSLPLLHYRREGGSERMRRQEKEVERSLHQIWVFLSCCALLCLFLF